jgi:hypothetical protein
VGCSRAGKEPGLECDREEEVQQGWSWTRRGEAEGGDPPDEEATPALRRPP